MYLRLKVTEVQRVWKVSGTPGPRKAPASETQGSRTISAIMAHNARERILFLMYPKRGCLMIVPPSG